MDSHGSYVALSPLFEFWEFLEVWWGQGPFVITISMSLWNLFVWYMFQKHKILSIVSFQLCSFYMQLVVKTIILIDKQNISWWIEHDPKQPISWRKLILMDKTNPIYRMKSMYESYPTTRILILMDEKWPK